MFRVDKIHGDTSAESVYAKHRLRVENATDAFEIRVAERIGLVLDFEGRWIGGRPLSEDVEGTILVIGGVELEIKLAPRIFLGDVAKTEIEASAADLSEILERSIDGSNRTSSVADDRTGKIDVNDRLRSKSQSANDVADINREPIDIGRKTVRPPKPTVFRIASPGGPNGPSEVGLPPVKTITLVAAPPCRGSFTIFGLAIGAANSATKGGTAIPSS